jgi:hypothetical protein
VPVLKSSDTPFDPEPIHAPVDAVYKEFKTGRRYPLAADRVIVAVLLQFNTNQR